MVKKLFALLLVVSLIFSLCACGSSNPGNYKSQSSTTHKSFTNKYGTSTTRCAHPGCSNYIASSGDTNCCRTHSNRCLNCGCYIDGDAMYCMSCLMG